MSAATTQNPVQEYENILSKSDKIPFGKLEPGCSNQVIGVIESADDFRLNTTKKNEWKITFRLHDPSIEGACISLNAFNRYKDKLPMDVKENDVIVIKNCVVEYFNRGVALRCSSDAEYALYRRKENQLYQIKMAANKCQVLEQEMVAVKYLAKWINNKKKQADDTPAPSRKRKHDRLLATYELLDTEEKYFDYIGMVVECKPTVSKIIEKGIKTELILTDFTPNKLPNKKLDAWNEIGLTPDLLIQATVWDRHAFDCRELQFGDFIFLDNCNKKTNDMGFLEISLRSYKNEGDKSCVVKLSEEDERLGSLLENRQKFVDKLKKKKERDSVYIRTRVTLPIDSIMMKDFLEEEKSLSAKHKLIAYVDEFRPSDPFDWIQFWCSSCSERVNIMLNRCPRCQKFAEETFVFQLLLKSFDNDSCVVVDVKGPAAVNFLGQPPAPASSQEETTSMKKFEKIVRLLADEDHRMYLEFGLEAVAAAQDDQNNKSLNYNLMDTKIIVEERGE